MLVFGILATLIPSFTTAWISYLQNKRSLREKITGELQSVSAQTAREMDLWVKERLYELRVFASSYEVSENLDLITRGRGAPALARLTDYLRSVRERFADYPELLVVNPRGEAVATTAREATPAHLPADWAAAMRADNAVLGDAYRDDALGKDVVVFAVPIYQTGGRLVGALTAKLDLAAVHHLLRRFAAGTSGRVYLITTGGQPLVGSEAERENLMQRQLDTAFTRRLLKHEGLTIEFTGLQGDRVVASAKRVPHVEWAVLVQVPAAEAFRQVTHLRNVTMLIVATLLVGVGLLAYVLGLLITRPLNRLTGGAARVAGADLAVALPGWRAWRSCSKSPLATWTARRGTAGRNSSWCCPRPRRRARPRPRNACRDGSRATRCWAGNSRSAWAWRSSPRTASLPTSCWPARTRRCTRPSVRDETVCCAPCASGPRAAR